MKKYILGIDPSGSFNEGKGTTGFCILNAETKELLCSEELSAKPYSSAEQYWNAHMKYMMKVYDIYGEELLLSIEDYILYGSKAASQTNSQMETSQLIGVLKTWAFTKSVPYTIRPAVRAKTRWTNEILEKLEYIHKGAGNRWFNNQGQPMNTHKIDALRHALHAAFFENREDKWHI